MQNYGQMIDKELIKELGLDQIHRDKLEGILDELAVILQPALSDKLEASLSDEQLDQFDQFLIKNDEMGAFSYLQQQIPNFTEVIKAVIADQKEILRSRVEMLIGGDPSLRATSEDQTILAAAPANPQPISPQPNPTNTTSPQLPSYSNQPPKPSNSATNNQPITNSTIAPPPKSYADKIARDKSINKPTKDAPPNSPKDSKQSGAGNSSNPTSQNDSTKLSGSNQAPHAFHLHGGNYNDYPNTQPQKSPGNLNSHQQPATNSDVKSSTTNPIPTPAPSSNPPKANNSTPYSPSSNPHPRQIQTNPSAGTQPTPSFDFSKPTKPQPTSNQEQTTNAKLGSIPQSIPAQPFSPKPLTDWTTSQSKPTPPPVASTAQSFSSSQDPKPYIVPQSTNDLSQTSAPTPNQPASTPAPSESAPNTPPQIKIPDVNAPDGVPNIYEDSYLRSSFNQSAPSNPQPQTAPDTNPQAPAKPAPPTINPFVQSAGSYAQNPTQPVSPNPYPNSPQNPVDSLTDPYAPPRNVSSTPPPTTYSTGIQTNPQPAAPASYPPASHPLSSTQSTPNPGFPQANSVSQPSPNNTPNTPASVPNSTTQPAQPWQPPANQVNQPTQPTTPSYDYTNPATNPNHPLNSLKQ